MIRSRKDIKVMAFSRGKSPNGNKLVSARK